MFDTICQIRLKIDQDFIPESKISQLVPISIKIQTYWILTKGEIGQP